jgi:hypothetical protein
LSGGGLRQRLVKKLYNPQGKSLREGSGSAGVEKSEGARTWHEAQHRTVRRVTGQVSVGKNYQNSVQKTEQKNLLSDEMCQKACGQKKTVCLFFVL